MPLPVRRGTQAVLRIGVAASVLGLATGCGGSADTKPGADRRPVAAVESAGQTLSAATLKPGQPVPPPTQRPVLTLTGRISVTNKGRALQLDRRTLDRLGVVQVKLYEPWAKKTLDFRGCWLQDLLAVAGVRPGATRLHITALDDYQVDLTIADVRRGGILLATMAGDGSTLPIDKGGPTRIVFMNGVKAGANADQWIWSLKTVDVE